MQEKILHFGKRLQFVLDQLGVSQAELADIVGVTRQSVNSWISKEFCSEKIMESLEPFAREYGIPPSYLYGGIVDGKTLGLQGLDKTREWLDELESNRLGPDFGERLQKVIEMLQIQRSDISDLAGVSPEAVRQWTQKKFASNTIKKKLDNIGQTYPVNMSYLLHGYGDPILENHPKFKMHFNNQNKIMKPEGTKAVPFFDVEVFGTVAESLSDAIPIHPDGYLEIPFFKRADFVVPVSGQSMKGKYNHGDWIAVRRIRNKDYIIYGEAYLVITKSDNYRTVKFLKEDKDDPNNLVLIPYNIEQFDPQTIPKTEIRELFIVVGVVRPS